MHAVETVQGSLTPNSVKYEGETVCAESEGRNRTRSSLKWRLRPTGASFLPLGAAPCLMVLFIPSASMQVRSLIRNPLEERHPAASKAAFHPKRKNPVEIAGQHLKPYTDVESASQYVPTYPRSTGTCSLHETGSFLLVPSRQSGKFALVVATTPRKLWDPGPDRPVPAKFNLRRTVAHESRNRRRRERGRERERSRRERRAALVAVASAMIRRFARVARKRTSDFRSREGHFSQRGRTAVRAEDARARVRARRRRWRRRLGTRRQDPDGRRWRTC